MFLQIARANDVIWVESEPNAGLSGLLGEKMFDSGVRGATRSAGHGLPKEANIQGRTGASGGGAERS